jgi:hypothetical protein
VFRKAKYGSSYLQIFWGHVGAVSCVLLAGDSSDACFLVGDIYGSLVLLHASILR